MKKIFVVALFGVLCLSAKAQIDLPPASPEGSTYSKLGFTDIKVKYSRPKVKGRKIFGEGDKYLQPFGKLWRSGANRGTFFSTSTDIKVEGKKLPEGKYMLLTIPNEESWTVIFYKDKSIGGNMKAYKEENAQLKVTVKPIKLVSPIETLTYNIADISEDNKTAALELAWSNTAIKVGLKVDFDEAAMQLIKKKTEVNEKNYVSAANYYFENGKDLNQALIWMNTYLKNNPKEFWNIHTKAKILAKLGKTKEAKASAKKSLTLAKASERGDFGYIKRNKELLKTL